MYVNPLHAETISLMEADSHAAAVEKVHEIIRDAHSNGESEVHISNVMIPLQQIGSASNVDSILANMGLHQDAYGVIDIEPFAKFMSSFTPPTANPQLNEATYMHSA